MASAEENEQLASVYARLGEVEARHLDFWDAQLVALGLFIIGTLISLLTGRRALYSGGRQLVLGLLAAGVTYGLGQLIGHIVDA